MSEYDFDFDEMVTLALRHEDDPSRSTTVFVGTLRIAVTVAAALPAEVRERAVIVGPGLPEDGIPPPPFDILAAQVSG